MERSLASVLTETLEAAQAQLDAARQLDLSGSPMLRPAVRTSNSSWRFFRAGMPCKWMPTLRMWSAVFRIQING